MSSFVFFALRINERIIKGWMSRGDVLAFLAKKSFTFGKGSTYSPSRGCTQITDMTLCESLGVQEFLRLKESARTAKVKLPVTKNTITDEEDGTVRFAWNVGA